MNFLVLIEVLFLFFCKSLKYKLLKLWQRLILPLFVKYMSVKAIAGRISTTELVNKIFIFCELYSGRTLFPYQEQFGKRVIRSIITNDGAEITALFARQSGKTETISVVVGGLMIILPRLANTPMFADDTRLQMFQDGFWVGIFAPSLRQSQITYNRIRSNLQSRTATAVLEDPEFNLYFNTSNGQTVSLNNGSFVTAISASDGASIEGESFKFIICEEAQDISNYKVRKCLTGDTSVLLSNGTYKRLDKIVEDKSDKIICFDKEMKSLVAKKPLEYYDNGIQDVYKVVLDNGEEIKATLNHQFYTYNQKTNGTKLKFRTLEEVVSTMNNDRPLRIGVSDILPYFSEPEMFGYEKGQIVGYFLGDGCTVGTPKFIGDRKTCNRLYQLINKVVDPNIKMAEYNFNVFNGMCEVCFSTPTNKKGSNTLRSFLKEYDLVDKTGVNKKLPNRLFSKDFYLGLISSLIETDGCIEEYMSKPIISFANISKNLVKQLKDILLKFGIHSTLFSRDNKGISENSKTLYLLHIKSVIDIKRFYANIKLFKKQVYLEKAFVTIRDKKSREQSKYYPCSMRFCKVVSVEYAGKERTYCIKVEGRNFIANNMISSNSIHPMGAAYNATMVKIGTSTTFKADFYDAIQRNKRDIEIMRKKTTGGIRNHFEYDCDVASKYNPKYAKYVEKEKKRLGEQSDEFQMSYKLKWIIARGMFIDITDFESRNCDPLLELMDYDKSVNHVAGIDVGGKGDDTVIFVNEVDWTMPVIMEERTDEETGEDITYVAFNTYVKGIHVIKNVPDYEEQYPMIMNYLDKWKLSRIYIDATRESSLAHRIRANRKEEVVPYIFTPKSKSIMYKHAEKEILSGRAKVPYGNNARQKNEIKEFLEQLSGLQKNYRGSYLVVSHSGEKDAHDDYPDAWALSLLAASSPGVVNETETRDNLFTKKDKNKNNFYRSRNRYTSKRR